MRSHSLILVVTPSFLYSLERSQLQKIFQKISVLAIGGENFVNTKYLYSIMNNNIYKTKIFNLYGTTEGMHKYVSCLNF